MLRGRRDDSLVSLLLLLLCSEQALREQNARANELKDAWPSQQPQGTRRLVSCLLSMTTYLGVSAPNRKALIAEFIFSLSARGDVGPPPSDSDPSDMSASSISAKSSQRQHLDQLAVNSSIAFRYCKSLTCGETRSTRRALYLMRRYVCVCVTLPVVRDEIQKMHIELSSALTKLRDR